MRNTIIAALALAALPLGIASAQTATTCNGRVFIDTIYQTGTGGNNFEYFIHLRNATRTRLTVDVTFTGFPNTVTLFSPSLPGIPIGANATISSLRFGRGTYNQVNISTVQRAYDVAAPAGPVVRLTNCRAA